MKNKHRFKFSVEFQVDNEPDSITIDELDKLIKYLDKISNDDYKFSFQTPMFLKITNNDGIELENDNTI